MTRVRRVTDLGEPARERVLRVAGELFSEHGFQAVGIDLIIERAGVAKATLYRHFPTKDHLIAAYLDAANERFWAWFDAAVDTALDPAETLARVFDAVATLATSPVCLGCSFQKAAAEFPERTHPGHHVALAHKDDVRERLRQLAVDADASHPDELADALLLVMDGAFASARMYGPDNPGRQAGTAARALINDQVRRPTRGRAR
jgi:AcrR family transcriptional regulator